MCKRAATDRYNASPKGQVTVVRAQNRYNASVRGYWRGRKHALVKQRKLLQAESDRLAAEEAMCRTSLARAMQTR